jgi:predicted MFS family arabinose efflux permease
VLVAAQTPASAARGQWPLLAALLLAGLAGTAMTQGLIGCAAVLADDGARGRIVGAVQGGVVLGLLGARVVAGVVADIAGWRAVYALSAGLMAAVAVLLWRMLPPLPAPAGAPPYPRLLGEMLALPRTDPVLRTRGLIALVMFAVFNVFWSALALQLSGPPHRLPPSAIGAFGLVGIAGALGAAHAGRWHDRGHGARVTGVALLLLAAAWLPLAFTPASLIALAGGIVVLDLAVQALHVTNQGAILGRGGAAPSRLIACYMLFYAAGSGVGALAGTAAHAAGGWPAVCALGAALSALALAGWFWIRKRTSSNAI